MTKPDIDFYSDAEQPKAIFTALLVAHFVSHDVPHNILLPSEYG